MKKITHILLFIILLFSVGCDNHNKNNGEYPFETTLFSEDNALPIVKIRLSNIPAKLIVDTGSEINIINSIYYYNHIDVFDVIDTKFTEIQTVSGKIYEETYVVKTFINDSIPIIFHVMNINNTIDNIFLNQHVYVDGIMGVDFLYDNKLIIDFNNKKITNLNKNASI